MKDTSKEFLVGCLVILVLGLIILFGWMMGIVRPLTPETHYHLLYSFAGGVEVGSPVRVSGVKVGRVESIEFLPQVMPRDADGATVKIAISVAKRASHAVRQDSRFYVNMAGIIGERYIEISPGSQSSAPLATGSEVRGVDPPRIDQLLSQGYGVFGKIQEFLDENESVVTEFLSETTGFLKDANHALKEANRLLRGEEKRKFFALVDNLNAITTDLRDITQSLKNEKNTRFVDQIRTLVDRAHQVDKEALKQFLQKEGVRARIF